MRQFCFPSVLFFFLPGTVAAEGTNVFDRLLISNPADLAEECRNDVIQLRVEQWRRSGDEIDPFASVEEILAAVRIEGASLLEDKGCGSRHIWNFFACTELDDPDADHIVPRGVTA